MQITVRLLASYRQYLPQGHDGPAGYALEVPPGATVAQVLDVLPMPEAEVSTFFVNGRHADGRHVLGAGDVLSVFPAVGGGS